MVLAHRLLIWTLQHLGSCIPGSDPVVGVGDTAEFPSSQPDLQPTLTEIPTFSYFPVLYFIGPTADPETNTLK